MTPAALKALTAGHPWIWRDSITSGPSDATVGDLAVIFDNQRRFRAIGLWDPHSPIAVRVLHAGKPTPIDDAFFERRVLESAAHRSELDDDPGTTAWRVVHGENDGLPGLVIDRYETVLVVRLDTAAWLPHLGPVVSAARALFDADTVVLRTSRRLHGLLPDGLVDGCALVGTAPSGPVPFLESGLHFLADVVHGQKTGHFLDQRENRRLVGAAVRGARVLDVFSNTGGFSILAAAGGATEVHAVDASAHAIDRLTRHWHANAGRFTGDCRLSTTVDDAFDTMAALRRTGERYDMVVIDPPSFAPRATAVAPAMGAYRRLTLLGLQLVAPGGRLFQASCSSRISGDDFRRVVLETIDASPRSRRGTVMTGHPRDHPVGFPEGEYLKAVMVDLD